MELSRTKKPGPLIARTIAVSLVGAVACCFFSASAEARPTPPTLRVNFQGGFGGINMMDPFSQPLAVIDSSGRLFRPVTEPKEPRPTLVRFTVLKLSKSAIADFEKLAGAAGLNKQVDAGVPQTADARELVVSFKGTTNVIASYGAGDEALPKKQLAVRNTIGSLITYLGELPAGKPATPTSVVLASYNYKNYSPDPNKTRKPQPPKAWPSKYAPLDGSCVELTGPSAAAAIKALESSNTDTPWTSNGNVWRIIGRPALPGDPGCNAG
jgi:hypothetical protein